MKFKTPQKKSNNEENLSYEENHGKCLAERESSYMEMESKYNGGRQIYKRVIHAQKNKK
jgi:hypothetical protein